MEIIIFILGLYFGYQIGQAITVWKIKDIIIKEAKSQGIDMSGLDDSHSLKQVDSVSQLFIERANNVLYLYDKEANSFICQASTIDELARLAKEYNNIKYASVMDEQSDAIVAFIDGKVENIILVKKHES
jgi:hypothetical protein